MPLNTQPLTPVRRAVLLLVLLGFFIGSLGLAYGLVSMRGSKKTDLVEPELKPGTKYKLNLSFQVPEGFEQAKDISIAGQPVRVFRGVGGEHNQQRLIYMFNFHLVVKKVTNQTLQQAAVTLFGTFFDHEPDQTVITQLMDRPAAESQGIMDDGSFGHIRVTVVQQNLVGFLYYGADAPTKQDVATWEEITKSVHFQIQYLKPTTNKAP